MRKRSAVSSAPRNIYARRPPRSLRSKHGMICQIYPQLEGVALERFRRLSKDVMQLQRTGQLDRLDGLRDGELQRCQAEAGLNGCRGKYEACTRVLIDLAKL